MSVISVRSDRSSCLAELRRQIGVIERSSSSTVPAGDISSFADMPLVEKTSTLDPFLAGGGRAAPALQELVADDYGSRPAVQGFSIALAVSLLHRQRQDRDMVLWCQRQRDVLEFGRPYGPGLRDLGLSPDRLLMVTGKRDADCLWAMEQALASRSLIAVIGMVGDIGLTASRRLSLAAKAHGTWCLLLPLKHGREPSAARTRWRIKTAPSLPDVLDPEGLGLPCWELALERSRNGSTGRWTVEWDHATHHFHLAPPLGAARRSSPNKVARRDGPDGQTTDVIAFDRTG